MEGQWREIKENQRKWKGHKRTGKEPKREITGQWQETKHNERKWKQPLGNEMSIKGNERTLKGKRKDINRTWKEHRRT